MGELQLLCNFCKRPCKAKTLKGLVLLEGVLAGVLAGADSLAGERFLQIPHRTTAWTRSAFGDSGTSVGRVKMLCVRSRVQACNVSTRTPWSVVCGVDEMLWCGVQKTTCLQETLSVRVSSGRPREGTRGVGEPANAVEMQSNSVIVIAAREGGNLPYKEGASLSHLLKIKILRSAGFELTTSAKIRRALGR